MKPYIGVNDPVHITFRQGGSEELYSVVASVHKGVIGYHCHKVTAAGVQIGNYSLGEAYWQPSRTSNVMADNHIALPKVNVEGWQDNLVSWFEQWVYKKDPTDQYYTLTAVHFGNA